MRHNRLPIAACVLALLPLALRAQAPAPRPPDPAREKRLEWFRDAKYGLFIHWGLYAIPAGEWQGKRSLGLGEWIMNRSKIPVRDSEKLAAQFNPVKFDADGWVQLAQDAGMAYGSVALIWFDTPRMMTPERGQRFAGLVRTLQPNTLIDGRLGTDGDYRSTGDNVIPPGASTEAWETPATINDTWGSGKTTPTGNLRAKSPSSSWTSSARGATI